MADLTSTINVTGNVGGKVINISHTFVMQDVADAQVFFTPDSASADTVLGPFMFRSLQLDCIMVSNRSNLVPCVMANDNGGLGQRGNWYLLPGQFVLFWSNASNELFEESATDTDYTLSVCQTVDIQNTAQVLAIPPVTVFVATQAAS